MIPTKEQLNVIGFSNVNPEHYRNITGLEIRLHPDSKIEIFDSKKTMFKGKLSNMEELKMMIRLNKNRR